jgi:hypothetical protein
MKNRRDLHKLFQVPSGCGSVHAPGEGVSERDDRPQLPRRIRFRRGMFSSLLSNLEYSDIQVYEYEPSSGPLHISAKLLLRYYPLFITWPLMA